MKDSSCVDDAEEMIANITIKDPEAYKFFENKKLSMSRK
jgi:hypothetical protein